MLRISIINKESNHSPEYPLYSAIVHVDDVFNEDTVNYFHNHANNVKRENNHNYMLTFEDNDKSRLLERLDTFKRGYSEQN
jgi:hypothetical protein